MSIFYVSIRIIDLKMSIFKCLYHVYLQSYIHVYIYDKINVMHRLHIILNFMQLHFPWSEIPF